MKINILILSLLIIFVYACSYPKYLASHDKIDINPYGSEVIITRTKIPTLYAELIASDSNQLIVRTYPRYKRPQKILQIPLNTIKNLRLRYAKPVNLGWAIPVLIVQTFATQGFISAITAPLNALFAAIIIDSGDYDYTYKLKHLSINDLKMFSRFPQGIPLNIPLDSIK